MAEHEVPYISLVESSVKGIMEHILEEGIERRDGGKVNIKLKRMIKDLYRKIYVKIIDQRYIKDKKAVQH